MTTSTVNFEIGVVGPVPSCDYYLIKSGELAGRNIVTNKNQSPVSWSDVAIVVGVLVLTGGILLAHNLYQNYNKPNFFAESDKTNYNRPKVFAEFDHENFAKYQINAQNDQIQSLPKDHYASLKLNVSSAQRYFMVINEGGTLKCTDLYYTTQVSIMEAYVKATPLKLYRVVCDVIDTTP